MNRILGNSSKGGKHPVSGNRGFGIKDNSDDTWTFYSKAVDRETPFWKNTFARKAGKDVFCLVHGFWRLFYGGMKDYLNPFLRLYAHRYGPCQPAFAAWPAALRRPAPPATLAHRFRERLMPYIAVAIPTCRRLPVLRRAIESVFAQTFEDWEMVVSDDETPPGDAWEFLRNLASSGRRVRPVMNDGPHGACSNHTARTCHSA
jgi:hypothetical protein